MKNNDTKWNRPSACLVWKHRLQACVAFSLLAGSAWAGPRTSANYTITTDTVDAGGKRSSSAAYTNDGSASLVVGISAVASPAETAKAGYVGQLFDVSGLVVNSAAPSVNETATLQLGAWQLLDDASFLAVPAPSVSWGVVSGPITGISAGGLATAGVVSQNTPASVQGVFGGYTGSLNLTVLDSIADNFGTYAGDGVGDDWQVQYFGQPPNANAGPNVDADGTGQTNLFKYVAGLNPLDPNSRFTVKIAAVPGQLGQQKLIFSPLVLTGGRSYVVNYRTDLTSGTWTALTGATQSDNGAERTVTDTSATGAKKFYRIEITKP